MSIWFDFYLSRDKEIKNQINKVDFNFFHTATTFMVSGNWIGLVYHLYNNSIPIIEAFCKAWTLHLNSIHERFRKLWVTILLLSMWSLWEGPSCALKRLVAHAPLENVISWTPDLTKKIILGVQQIYSSYKTTRGQFIMPLGAAGMGVKPCVIFSGGFFWNNKYKNLATLIFFKKI